MVEAVSKAFLSYVHEDIDVAEKIQRNLQRNGIGVWRDKDELPGRSRWKKRIRDAIRSGTYFLALHSHQRPKKKKSYANDELIVAIEELRLRLTSEIWLIPIRNNDCEIEDRPIGGGEYYSDIQVEDLRDFEPGIVKLLRNLGVSNPAIADEKKAPIRGEFTAPQGSPFAAIKALEELNKLPDDAEVPIDALATAYGKNTISNLSCLNLIGSGVRGHFKLVDPGNDARHALAMAIAKIPAFQVVVGELKKNFNSTGLELGYKIADYLGRDWSEASCRRNGQAYKKWAINLYPNLRLPKDGDESYLLARAISTQISRRGRASLITADVLLKISMLKRSGMSILEIAKELHVSPSTIRNWKRSNPDRWDKL